MKFDMKIRIVISILSIIGMSIISADINAAKPKPPTTISAQTTQAQSSTSQESKVKKLLERAMKGEAAAQNELGVCYMKGLGVAKNDTLAYKWFTRSAAQKYTKGILNMAYCLRHGTGVKSDSLKARDLYINAIGQGKDSVLNILDNASQKDVFMARTLAYAYANGKGGLKRNLSAVKTYLKRAIDNGDKSAYYPYAEYCFRTRDHGSAQKAYGEAYKNGDKRAAYWYGRYLITGEGGNPNPAQGYKLVYPFALDGKKGAMELVGLCLLNGNGVDANPGEAVNWFTKAARKGSTEAQWQLSLCNIRGTGTDRNFMNAFNWMQREAMHSSENRFKDFLNPSNDNAMLYPQYLLFLQGIKAIHNNDFTSAKAIAKELVKQKADKEGKVIEGMILINSNNPQRNVKKGYKLLAPYIDSDPYILYYIDKCQLNGELDGLDKKQMRNVTGDLEELGEAGMGQAYSLLGDLYLYGKAGLTASEQKAIIYWLKALESDGLSYNSAQTLARCYQDGIGGLNKDVEKARYIRNLYKADNYNTLIKLIPEYTVRDDKKVLGIF